MADKPDINGILERLDAQDRERERLQERDRVRRDVGAQVERAAMQASAVGMPLGMWAGRGDYAKFSEESRDNAGQRALTELDNAISLLGNARQLLADTLAEQQRADG